jgi:hypothetical protein
MFIYKINIPSGNYLQHNYYVSDLIDRCIDFDKWEFFIVWATRISFLDVLSAVPPFLLHGTVRSLENIVISDKYFLRNLFFAREFVLEEIFSNNNLIIYVR